MTPGARVWLASPEEGPAVAQLLVEFRDWQGRSEPPAASFEAGVRRLIDDPGAEYLLAAVGGEAEPAGVCQLRYRYGLWYAAEDCWLEDVYVRESARSAGLGGGLVDAAIERALGRGCRRIELDADSDNEAALELYGRRGFSASTGGGAERLMLRRTLAPTS